MYLLRISFCQEILCNSFQARAERVFYIFTLNSVKMNCKFAFMIIYFFCYTRKYKTHVCQFVQ